jgi:hypothetical protein
MCSRLVGRKGWAWSGRSSAAEQVLGFKLATSASEVAEVGLAALVALLGPSGLPRLLTVELRVGEPAVGGVDHPGLRETLVVFWGAVPAALHPPGQLRVVRDEGLSRGEKCQVRFG